MPKLKNAKRKHFVGEYDLENPTVEPEEAGYFPLAAGISSIGDDSDEETDDTGFYDGDGSPQTTVTSVVGTYSPEGFYIPEDRAQALIAKMKYKIGDERKIWHKIISSDGKTEISGVATVTDPIAGAGDATEYEDFSCSIAFNKIPVEKAVAP